MDKFILEKIYNKMIAWQQKHEKITHNAKT